MQHYHICVSCNLVNAYPIRAGNPSVVHTGRALSGAPGL